MGLIEIGLLLVGLVLGPLINFAIYNFAYFPRPISPWNASPESIPKRTWHARLPVIGWLVRISEGKQFGRIFWLRPFLLELATPIAMVVLYRFCVAGTFSPVGLVAVPLSTLQHQYIAYALLISLMTVATFIDFDERTIPDLVTIPGTIMGLIGSIVVPDWRMHELALPVAPALVGMPVAIHANSPEAWNPAWDSQIGLLCGLFFWSLWCFGMADRRWITRRGLSKAFGYFVEVLRRSPSTKLLARTWMSGGLLICLAFVFCSHTQWESLLSSLFGMGLGGTLIWGFRIVAGWAMGQEALGFGDVTLMAMIGSFFGWQIVWPAFFLAPFFSMIIVVIVFIVTRDGSLPFGPYLCAATLYCMLDWVRLWGWCSSMFMPPELMFVLFLSLLIALGAMLWVIQMIKSLLLGTESS